MKECLEAKGRLDALGSLSEDEGLLDGEDEEEEDAEERDEEEEKVEVKKEKVDKDNGGEEKVVKVEEEKEDGENRHYGGRADEENNVENQVMVQAKENGVERRDTPQQRPVSAYC